MLSFTEAAERLVKDRIAPNMTAEGLRRLARDPHSGWPIGPKDYRVVGKTRTLPYDLLAPYMRERLSKRPGRGPAKQPGKKRAVRKPQQQQGEPMTTTTVDARKDLYAFAMDGKEHSPAISDRASEKIDAFRASVVAEVMEALQAKGAELSELAEEEMRPSIEERAQTWYEAADAAAKLKRQEPAE